MKSEKIAGIVSILLGPHIWLPVLLVASLFRSGLTSSQLYILFPSLIIFQILIPIAYIHIALRLGKVSAWDLPKKEERYLFLGISFASYLISVLVIYFFGNQLLLSLSLIILVLLTVLAIITYFWKISLHTSMNTGGAILLDFLFNWQIPWVFLMIPIIFWSRLLLKRHNFAQLIAGIIVSGGITLGALYYLKYI